MIQTHMDYSGRSMHLHSIKAHHEEEPKLGKRASLILNLLCNPSMGESTDREVKEMLGFSDMNSVRPRITELLKMGLLVECGSKECPVTGKLVRIVKAKG
jgi:hypothetical protein